MAYAAILAQSGGVDRKKDMTVACLGDSRMVDGMKISPSFAVSDNEWYLTIAAWDYDSGNDGIPGILGSTYLAVR